MKLIIGILLVISLATLAGLIMGIYISFKIPNQKFILNVLISILFIALCGFGISLKTIYRAHKQIYTINQLRHQLSSKQNLFDDINKKMSKQLLFIHHSVGKSWLEQGGLAAHLIKYGVGVHSATYGDDIGEETDMNHWVLKFQNNMEKIFMFNCSPNIYNDENVENNIIMFKSCFPNSNIIGLGTKPGNQLESERTIWNYKSTFNKLINEFSKYPEKVFIYVTAPPLAPNATNAKSATFAREFNNWVKLDFSKKYFEKTNLNNFLVFDFFDVLTDENNYLKKEYRVSEKDSHPNRIGTTQATERFIEFLKFHEIIDSCFFN